MQVKSLFLSTAAALVLVACGGPSQTSPSENSSAVSQGKQAIENTPRTVVISADGDFSMALQTALITASEGDIVQLPEGTFNLTDGLSLDIDHVTLKGAGQGKTVLSFKGQTGAGEGLLVTSDDVTLANFTMQDTAGDGIKSKGADRIIYRDLTVEWTGGIDEKNGAYGIYPVESTDVLIEKVTVRGASDAGIYVGQSRNIIVRNSLAEYNVAGIEIENSIGADVYGNTATNNAGGILVFDLPDLPQIGGNATRIFGNKINNNNTRNFAPPGNIVASVPSGTGVIVLANESVHIFDNEMTDNRTAHVLITAYQDTFQDARYNPLARNIVVRDNAYSGGGDDPQGALQPLAAAMGGAFPPIVWDGVTAWAGGAPTDPNIVISEPESVGFLSLGMGTYPINPATLAPSQERPVSRPVVEPAKVVLVHDQTAS